MTILLFEDAAVAQLHPVTVGKPAFAVNCGGYRLVDLLAELDAEATSVVRPHLGELQRADFGHAPLSPASSTPLLAVNARLVPSVAALGRLKAIVKANRPGIVRADDGAVVAALLPPGAALPNDVLTPERLPAHLGGLDLPALGAPASSQATPLVEYPHDIIRHHQTTLLANLEHRLAGGDYREIADGVFAAPGAALGEHVVTDAKGGPIVLEAGAKVGPYCYLSGPAHLGAHSRVIEHSAIKDGVVLGHTTKIGGEIEASIIEPYTNKQHHGFLGHSYLGSWINLGAGTCNSDLKNTYGAVNMEYDGRKVSTGMQFVGAIIGDYAKTAINTGIFTGKTIGVCSMLYGFVTTNVPSFVNYARSFGQTTETPVEVMISTQSRMFERRGVAQRPCDIQLMHDMFELTRYERQIAGEPLSL